MENSFEMSFPFCNGEYVITCYSNIFLHLVLKKLLSKHNLNKQMNDLKS